MATLELNQIYTPESASEISADFLADMRLEGRKFGIEPAIQPGTDNHIFATAVAEAVFLIHGNSAIIIDQANPLTATGQYLDNFRRGYGLPVVDPTGASGNIVLSVSGTATVPAGTELTLPNGLRAQVVGTWPGVVDGDEIEVVCVDTGEATNQAAGTVLRFTNPPLNVDTEAKVATGKPLTGGTDEEDDERKRTRILNKIRSGGDTSWGFARGVALNALGSIQDAFVYPALGGPASFKLVVVKDFDLENADYSRTPTNSALNTVRSAIWAKYPGQNEIVVQGAAAQAVDVSIKVTIPDSALSGGNGQGWIDATPWPQLEVADSGRVTISTVTANDQITVSANTATSPVAGQTHIVWWSTADRRFRQYLVTAVAGSTGAWQLTLDRPLTDSTNAGPATGDWIGPAAVNSAAYGTSWIDAMRNLGPGENTSDANRLPRAKRHPFTTDEAPPDITFRTLDRFVDAHSEITDAEYGSAATTTPTVPGSVATAPNVLTPRRFGVYPK